jgi:tetratricopeptide (TPR) repeat protein
MSNTLTPPELLAALNHANDLEGSGQFREAIAACEEAAAQTDAPEVHLALARNRFALAAAGDDALARPALEAALEGIARRCPGQPDVDYAIGICRWVAARLADPVPPPPPPPAAPTPPPGLLDRVTELEAAGRHQEAVGACEAAGDTPCPEVHFALARNAFSLAAAGDETAAWPALLAALDGLERLTGERPDATFSVGVCRWVLDLFADPHRLDVGRLAGRSVRPDQPAALDGDPIAVCNAVLAAAPPRVRHGRGGGWLARESAYLTACALAGTDPGRAGGVLDAAGLPLPGGYEGQLYDRYLLTSAQVRRRARAGRAPSVLVTAIPKSASEFLSYTLAEALGAAVARVTIGDPFAGAVSAAWAAEAAGGGCVLHDHFAATEANLAALRAAGVGRLAVLVRDPRAVAWSLAVMEAEYADTGPAAPPTPELVARLSGWIDTWVRAAAAGFPVEFIRFQELVADPEGVLGGLLDARGAGGFRPRLHEVLEERARRPRASSNFRRGDDDAWRSHVPSESHAAVWDAIPAGVRDLLHLRP